MAANENVANSAEKDQQQLSLLKIEPKVAIDSLLFKFSDAAKSKNIEEPQRKKIIEMLEIVRSMLDYINILDGELQDPCLGWVENEIKQDKRTFMSELCTMMCVSIIKEQVIPHKQRIKEYTEAMQKKSHLENGRIFYSEFSIFSCRAKNLFNSLNKASPEQEISLKL